MIEAGIEMIEAGLAGVRAENEVSKARLHLAKAEQVLSDDSVDPAIAERLTMIQELREGFNARLRESEAK